MGLWHFCYPIEQFGLEPDLGSNTTTQETYPAKNAKLGDADIAAVSWFRRTAATNLPLRPQLTDCQYCGERANRSRLRRAILRVRPEQGFRFQCLFAPKIDLQAQRLDRQSRRRWKVQSDLVADRVDHCCKLRESQGIVAIVCAYRGSFACRKARPASKEGFHADMNLEKQQLLCPVGTVDALRLLRQKVGCLVGRPNQSRQNKNSKPALSLQSSSQCSDELQ